MGHFQDYENNIKELINDDDSYLVLYNGKAIRRNINDEEVEVNSDDSFDPYEICERKRTSIEEEIVTKSPFTVSIHIIKAVNLKEFESLPYISLRPDSDLYSRSLKIFHHYNAEANYAMYVDQMITEYFMTNNGYGYSIIRDGTVNIVPEDKNPESPSVLYFLLDDLLAVRDLNFYYRDKEYLPPSAKMFLKQFDEKTDREV